MLNWLRQILGGNHTPDFPETARVDRDVLGRIVKVEAEIGSTRSDDAQIALQTSPSHAFNEKLEHASRVLVNRNKILAEYGIGRETRFDFDQDTQCLNLQFADGRQMNFRAEIVGSFDPTDGSFKWAWANESVYLPDNALAERLKQSGDESGESLLSKPVQNLPFNRVERLMAYAVEFGAADGIYRGITNSHTSIFLALYLDLETHFKADLDVKRARDADEFVVRYDAEMLPIDIAFNAQIDRTDMGPLLLKKQAVYDRFWRRDDDFWAPISFSWPSEHDTARDRFRFVLPGEDEAIIVARIQGVQRTAYKVERFEEGLRITDILLNWGNAFIWPGS